MTGLSSCFTISTMIVQYKLCHHDRHRPSYACMTCHTTLPARKIKELCPSSFVQAFCSIKVTEDEGWKAQLAVIGHCTPGRHIAIVSSLVDQPRVILYANNGNPSCSRTLVELCGPLQRFPQPALAAGQLNPGL